jgi:hypothetical protein
MAVDSTQPVYPPQTLTPITSTWGQAVSDAVVQKFASSIDRTNKWINPPAGSLSTIIGSGSVDIYRDDNWWPINYSAHEMFEHSGGNVEQGVIDLGLTQMLPAQVPFELHATVWITFEWGFAGAGGLISSFDVVGDGTHVGIIQDTAQLHCAAASQWQQATINASWRIGAGQPPVFKTRMHNFVPTGTWGRSYGVYQIQRSSPQAAQLRPAPETPAKTP